MINLKVSKTDNLSVGKKIEDSRLDSASGIDSRTFYKTVNNCPLKKTSQKCLNVPKNLF